MKDLFKTVCVVYCTTKLLKASADALIKIGEAKACIKMGMKCKKIFDEFEKEEEESNESH